MTTGIQRFTAYRRNLSAVGRHSVDQSNADDKPQFEGVIWSDGTVTLRWLTPMASTSVWPSIEAAIAVHGHPEYGTDILWHDAPEPKCWTDAIIDYNVKQAIFGGHRVI